MLWEGKSLGQTQSTLMGRKRLIASNLGRPHCLRMAGPQDSWGSRVGRVGRWGWGSGLCCFLYYSADPDNPDMWLSRRNSLAAQNSKPKPQDPSPKLSGKDGLRALFLKQRKRMFIILWEIREVQVSLKPWTLWGDLKIHVEWDFIMEFVDSIMEEDGVISEQFFTVCQG